MLRYLHHPKLGACSAAVLLRQYKSREVFDALLAGVRARGEDADVCGRALPKTDLPGIEPELTALLPTLEEHYAASGVATLLAKRQYAPAEGALVQWLNRVAPRNTGVVAWSLVPLDTPGLPDAFARRAAGLRLVPLDAEMEGNIMSLMAALARVAPKTRLDRSILSPEVVAAFPPRHREKVVAGLREREEVERRTVETSPANLAFWVRRGQNAMVRDFIARGADLDAVEPERRDTPLILAVRYSNWTALELLLAAGADPDRRDWEGKTALRLLPWKPQGHGLDEAPLQAARKLVARRANLDLADKEQAAPLHAATWQRNLPLVQLLVESGASVNAEADEMGISGRTPTTVAEDLGYTEIAQYLRSKGGTQNSAFLAKRAAQRAATKILAPILRGH